MLNSARITCDFLGLRNGDSALLCLPLDYIAGKMMVVRSIERHLNLHCVEPSNHPLRNLDATSTDGEAYSLIAMVPSQVYSTLQDPIERELLMRTRHLIIGGGAISRNLEEELRHFPNAVWSTYGMTETLSHIALRRLNGPEASPWYVPFDSVSVSVNADGCLVIDAPLVHDGILVTNDIAELREDGRFRIIGRRDNVICCGGIKLHIEQIEEKLLPAIRTPFCIAKRQDEKFGEVAVLLTTEQRNDWQEIFSDTLSRYECPKDIILVDSIPMTETGKVSRRQAEERANGECIMHNA